MKKIQLIQKECFDFSFKSSPHVITLGASCDLFYDFGFIRVEKSKKSGHFMVRVKSTFSNSHFPPQVFMESQAVTVFHWATFSQEPLNLIDAVDDFIFAIMLSIGNLRCLTNIEALKQRIEETIQIMSLEDIKKKVMDDLLKKWN